MRSNKDLMEKDLRETQLRNQRYWDQFRQRRQVVVRGYIDQKSVQRRAELYLRLMHAHLIVRRLHKNFSARVARRHYEFAWRVITAKARYKVQQLLLKSRSFDHLQRNRNRDGLTLASLLFKEQYEQDSLVMLREFLVDNLQTQAFRFVLRDRVTVWGQAISIVQRRIKDKMATKNAEHAVLLRLWDRHLFQVAASSNRIVKTFCTTALGIGNDVKAEVLQMYIQACQYQHLVAFSQWRYIHHKEKTQMMIKAAKGNNNR